MRLTGRLAVLLAVAAAFVPPAAAQDDEPKKYALLIGINDYTFRDTQIASLAYATLDARAMKRILEDKGYKTVDLIDDEAERDRIVGHLSRIGAVARKNDTFLLYFAGHGVRSKVGKTPTYWLTYDADTRRLDVKGIRLSHLLDYVADIKADRKMVILDHCFSGDVDLKVGTTTDPSRSVDDVTSATIIPAARPAIPTDVFNVAAAQGGSGTLIIAAARGAAYEIPTSPDRTQGHGVLTTALLRAWESRDADTNNDKKLSATELMTYLRAEVRRLSTGAGVAQEMLTSAGGVDLDAWIVAENLPSALNAQQARELSAGYNRQLLDWQLTDLVTPRDIQDAAEMLEAWAASLGGGRALAEREEKAIGNFRGVMEDQSRSPRARASLVKPLLDLFFGRTP